MTILSFHSLSKPPIFVDFKSAAKADFSILFMRLLEILDPHRWYFLS